MVFLSYSRKDSDFVLEIAKTLREAGAEIWLDQLDIEPGTSWDDSIENALGQADTLLVFLSKTSVSSKNVRDEYSFAFDEKKRIVPVLMEECTIPFRLRRLQYADFTEEKSTGINTLFETLNLKSKRTSNIENEESQSKIIPKPKSSGKPKARKSLPVILGLAVIAIVYFAASNGNWFTGTDASQITVFVHDNAGKDQLVLPNRGQIKLIYGDASRIETINSKGEATFKQIPNVFFDDNAAVEILFEDPEGEPYRSVHSDSLYHLVKNSYIRVPVKLFGLEEITGIVKDFESGDPIANARVSISGIEVFSNDYGEYALEIPVEKQQKYQTVRAFKDGYELYEISNVPIQTNQELPIVMKPKKSQ